MRDEPRRRGASHYQPAQRGSDRHSPREEFRLHMCSRFGVFRRSRRSLIPGKPVTKNGPDHRLLFGTGSALRVNLADLDILRNPLYVNLACEYIRELHMHKL